jgi:hypothetical protein
MAGPFGDFCRLRMAAITGGSVADWASPLPETTSGQCSRKASKGSAPRPSFPMTRAASRKSGSSAAVYMAPGRRVAFVENIGGGREAAVERRPGRLRLRVGHQALARVGDRADAGDGHRIQPKMAAMA